MVHTIQSDSWVTDPYNLKKLSVKIHILRSLTTETRLHRSVGLSRSYNYLG